MRQKEEFTRKLLELLAKTAVGAADLFIFFLKVRRGMSYSQINRLWHETMTHYDEPLKSRESEKTEELQKEKRRLRQQYHSFLYRLKSDGLIQEKIAKSEKRYKLTAKGEQELKRLQEMQESRLPPLSYQPEKSSELILFIFDIPEKKRQMRDWLRRVLRALEFTMIQKSVWAGKIKLQQDFIKDLYKSGLAEYIEIIKVTKGGTLQHLL